MGGIPYRPLLVRHARRITVGGSSRTLLGNGSGIVPSAQQSAAGSLHGGCAGAKVGDPRNLPKGGAPLCRCKDFRGTSDSEEKTSIMKHLTTTVILSLVVISTAFAKTLVNVDKAGVALKGYDPVAYFKETKAVKGDPQFRSEVGDVVYYFASAENKAAFDAAPAKYEPQFGGFCAWAVSRGYTASIDPNAFQIVDGRLLLQYSLKVRKDFSADTEGNLRKADANWPSIVEKKGK